MARKPSRSREFRKNSKVINMEEARTARREKRKALIEAETEKRGKIDEKNSARNKARKSRRRLVYAAVFLGIAAIIVVSAYNVLSLLEEKAEMEAKQQELIEMKERLQQELANVNTPEYIEQQARSQLRLVMPGEILFILPKEDNDSAGAALNQQLEEQEE